MFQIATIVMLLLLAIASPDLALMTLPIAWAMVDRLRARHAEHKRQLTVFLEHQREVERHKAARLFL